MSAKCNPQEKMAHAKADVYSQGNHLIKARPRLHPCYFFKGFLTETNRQ